MKNKIVSAACMFSLLTFGAFANTDIENPIFMPEAKYFFFSKSCYFYYSTLRASQKFTYGINGIMALGADIKYQQDFNSDQDGFSNVGLDLVYRMSNSGMISDLLIGLDFSKDSDVEEFSHTMYSTGYRLGKKWARWTLAGTIKTNWIFDEADGYAYIDMMPEVYYRISQMWGMGLDYQVRKATNSGLDRKWLGFKLSQIFGRTQYSEFVKYEFRTDDFTVGAKVHILF